MPPWLIFSNHFYIIFEIVYNLQRTNAMYSQFHRPTCCWRGGEPVYAIYWFSGLLLLQMKEAARTLDALDVDQDGRVDNKIKQKKWGEGIQG